MCTRRWLVCTAIDGVTLAHETGVGMCGGQGQPSGHAHRHNVGRCGGQGHPSRHAGLGGRLPMLHVPLPAFLPCTEPHCESIALGEYSQDGQEPKLMVAWSVRHRSG